MDAVGAFVLFMAGFPAGLVAVAVLRNATEQRNRAVARWTLLFGGLSLAVIGAALAGMFEPLPTKQFLAVLFVGLPAFPVGLILLLASRRRSNG